MRLFCLCLLSVCLPLSVAGQSAPATPQSTPALTEVASGVDDLNRQLSEIKRRLSDTDITTTQQKFEGLSSELRTRAQQAEEMLQSLPALTDLQDLGSEWASLSAKLAAAEKELVGKAARLNNDINWLDSQQSRWTTILGQLQSDTSLPELHSRVAQSIAEIQSTRATVESQLRLIVTLQTRTSELDQLVSGITGRIENEKTQVQKGLFQPDSSPLWDFAARRKTDLGLQRVLRKQYTRDLTRVREFIVARRSALLVVFLIVVVTLVAAIRMRRRLPAWTSSEIVGPRSIHIFQRPYSVAVLGGALAALPLLPTAPTAVRGLISLIMVVPVVRLLGPLIQPVDRQLLFALLISNFVIHGIKITTVSNSLKRDLLALSTLVIALLAGWLSQVMWRNVKRKWSARSVAVILIRFGVVLLLAAFAANLFGYFALSQVLTEGVLLGGYNAVILYTAKEVITIFIATILKTENANVLSVVRNHAQSIRRWSSLFVLLVVWLAWLSSVLKILTIRDDLFDAGRTILTTPFGAGEGSFTGADVITFILVLLAGIIVASASRVVLREDVLKRLPVSHGVPFAVSTITYYVLLFFVFLLALVAAGVQLSKFTIFTGAFGIGVGFGLQNTINNFASGIVLLLERPIREHDILEVDGAFGEVTRIGMRSTSIRTSEEAEVILPNSNLVTGKVINWSRLGRRRPVEIPIKVNYGMNPQAVIDLLVKTAATHPDVLGDPAPAAFLQRFGEKALEFVLVFWVARYHLHRKVLSEVAIRVSEAFNEAGIQTPIPEGKAVGLSVGGEVGSAV